MHRGRFNSHHIRRIRQIAALEGFTGIASVRVALDAVNAGVAAAGGMLSTGMMTLK
jgi:hypothetical protein